MDVRGVERNPPLRGKLPRALLQKIHCHPRMTGGFSQHDPAEKIRDYELRIEANDRGEKIVETVIIVAGHFPVPRNLHRLQPCDISEEVPESERERWTVTGRTEQRGGISDSTFQRPPGWDRTRDRGGKKDQRDKEKPGGEPGSSSSVLPPTVIDMGPGSSTNQRSLSSSARPSAASLHFAARDSHARN
jgi:hypothetical protein